MARIVVFQHGPRQTAGRLGMTLRDHGFALDVRRVDIPIDQGGHTVPEDLDGIHGVVSLGGPQNVDESHPWIRRETEFLKAAHEAQLPVIGICLGAQLISVALGGEVGRMDKPEAGFCTIDVQFMGQTDRILAGIAWRHFQFQSHAYETKKMPAGATLLASSGACKVQAYTVGLRTYAFQFHPELDRPAIDAMVKAQGKLLGEAGIEPPTISEQADKHYESYARLCDRLCLNIASYAFAPAELLKA
ncbi:MAG: type 1 glutamine amidotransferase [Phycisphaeraceae bacterium]|nr:MAG: type 1 glutamine amidotransferase [Phycisphaeraceae bacterium]